MMEAWWHSLKSLVSGLVRSRTLQTIKTEISAKITCYNLLWTIRRSYGFEPNLKLQNFYSVMTSESN